MSLGFDLGFVVVSSSRLPVLMFVSRLRIVQAPAYPPGERVVPLSPAGPPPPPPPQTHNHHRQIHASRPPPRGSHGVRPPAVPTVPMRAPAASTGGTSDNLQQTPCHSRNPPTPKAIPHSGLPILPKVSRRRSTQCRLGWARSLPSHHGESHVPCPVGVDSAVHFVQTRSTNPVTDAGVRCLSGHSMVGHESDKAVRQ